MNRRGLVSCRREIRYLSMPPSILKAPPKVRNLMMVNACTRLRWLPGRGRLKAGTHRKRPAGNGVNAER